MRTIIKLVSTAKTGHFYTTTKNPKLGNGKLELRKYDPEARAVPGSQDLSVHQRTWSAEGHSSSPSPGQR